MKSNNHIILLKLIMAALILQIYFLYNYYSLKIYDSELYQLSREYNATAQAMTIYSFAKNSQTMLFTGEA